MNPGVTAIYNFLCRNAFVLVPAIVVLVTYYPVSENGFVWDDYKAFVHYPYYQDITYLGRAFSEPLIFFPDYYRPLTSASFILQIHFFGSEPYHLHLASLLLHTSNTVLVALLTAELTGIHSKRAQLLWLPLVVALLYGLHPALIEPVALISTRFDLLATLFMLLLLFADTRLAGMNYRHLVVGLLFLIAALAKEMAVAVALVLPFWHLALARETTLAPRRLLREASMRGDFRVYFAIILAGTIYLLIRYYALGYLISANQTVAETGGSWLAHGLLIGRSISEYLSLILLPFHQLGPAHPASLPLNPQLPLNWLCALTLPGLLVVAGLIIRKAPATGWLVAGLTMSLLPIANVFIIHRPAGSFFSESYLVFPVAMFAFLVGAAVMDLASSHAVRNTRVAVVGAGIFYLFWIAISVFTIQTTIPFWKNDLALWTWAANRYPESTTALNNLATELNARQRFAAAEQLALRATVIDPRMAVTWATLGVAQTGQNKFAEAESSFRKSVALHFENADTWIAYSKLKFKQGSHDEAIEILEEIVLANEPDNFSALITLAEIYENAGARDKAQAVWRKALAVTTGAETRSYIRLRLRAAGH